MLKYLNLVIGAEAAFRKGACPKLTGEDMVMQDLDFGKLTGTWYIQVMDKDGYDGYFPECHQEQIWTVPESDMLYSLITEYQDEVLSGFQGTAECQK